MTEFFPELLSCKVCPHDCGINRHESTGFCGAGSQLKINLAQLHHGEEPVLSGTGGSGTIFFSHCNLRCVFCQNHTISHQGWGRHYEIGECVDLMFRLADSGAHNINLVSPTHYTPLLVIALSLAKKAGLHIPIVWNSNAYEHVESLKQLDGLVDIYLPDIKYAHNIYSTKYSGAPDYPLRALDAVSEMHRQTGDLTLDENGLAERGVLVRHLVLPRRIAGTREVLYRLRERIGDTLSLSLMAQYYPAARAKEFAELSRGITLEEYEEAVDITQELDFKQVFIQELTSSSAWTPSFSPHVETVNPDNLHFRGDNTNG